MAVREAVDTAAVVAVAVTSVLMVVEVVVATSAPKEAIEGQDPARLRRRRPPRRLPLHLQQRRLKHRSRRPGSKHQLSERVTMVFSSGSAIVDSRRCLCAVITLHYTLSRLTTNGAGRSGDHQPSTSES